MLLLFNDIINWLRLHELPCPVRSYLHFDCPGCGMQRSFVALLEGNLSLSIQYHFATIPFITFLLFALVQLFFKFKAGYKIIIYGYLFVVLIVITNYIYKIIT